MAIRLRLAAAAAGLLLTATVAAGCSGDDSDSGGSGASTNSGEAAPPQGDSRQGNPAQPDADGKATAQPESGGSGSKAQQPSLARAIIKTGFLTLEADDLAKTRDQVIDLTDKYRGQVANEETGTDDEGRIDRANLVLRIPTASYDVAMRALSDPKVGKVKQVRQESADVTEQVVDVNSRIATQRAGLARMRALMSRANTIGEVVNVETELTRREADLEALLAKQKALAAQTELATITVTLARPGEAPPPPKEDRSGFLGGLSAGWDAFSATATALATAAGALLPFGVTAAVVAVPAWLVYRRQRRPAPATAPAQAPPD